MVGAARPWPSRFALFAHCVAQKGAGFQQLTSVGPLLGWFTCSTPSGASKAMDRDSDGSEHYNRRASERGSVGVQVRRGVGWAGHDDDDECARCCTSWMGRRVKGGEAYRRANSGLKDQKSGRAGARTS